MTLAALIGAYHDASDGGVLRATLPLAGRTLIERQARLAWGAGVSSIVIVVDLLPPELAAAVERLRGEGMHVVIARSPAAAVEAIGADHRFLLIADGLIADQSHVTRLVSAEGAVLLTIPDHGVDDRFERIDAQSRWAGLAMLNGETLRGTVAMLQDWDLQSTLLRRAVQAGARQFALRGEPADDRLTIAERASDLADVQARIVHGVSAPRGDWAARYLLTPVEQAATRQLIPTFVSSGQLYIAAAALTALGALLFAKGLLWAGLIALLLGTPLDGIAERLAVLRMRTDEERGWARAALPLLGGAALAALGYTVSLTQGWGCLVLVVTALAFLAALQGEATGRALDGRVFLPERRGMIWLMVPFALTGLWAWGLGALAAYAAGGFFWAQRQVHRPNSETRHD